MKSQVLLTVWCNISGGAGGEIWHWSLSGVKGLNSFQTRFKWFSIAFEFFPIAAFRQEGHIICKPLMLLTSRTSVLAWGDSTLVMRCRRRSFIADVPKCFVSSSTKFSLLFKNSFIWGQRDSGMRTILARFEVSGSALVWSLVRMTLD